MRNRSRANSNSPVTKIRKVMNVGRDKLLKLRVSQPIEVSITNPHDWMRIRSNVRYANNAYGRNLGWRIRTKIDATKTKIQIIKENL